MIMITCKCRWPSICTSCITKVFLQICIVSLDSLTNEKEGCAWIRKFQVNVNGECFIKKCDT